ncbi:hypothetical protein AFA_08490 [Alcaligenes faecalis]|uniref:Uncharacterized protein n=1 Tax=Alcaligenes faecalis TaxID=511 RepID=A0AB33CSG9_ALCFA|nr:hypothetical protein AFA_08490 [Alcaligenes faecalis]
MPYWHQSLCCNRSTQPLSLPEHIATLSRPGKHVISPVSSSLVCSPIKKPAHFQQAGFFYEDGPQPLLRLAWLGLAWLGLAWLGLAWLGSHQTSCLAKAQATDAAPWTKRFALAVAGPPDHQRRHPWVRPPESGPDP